MKPKFCVRTPKLMQEGAQPSQLSLYVKEKAYTVCSQGVMDFMQLGIYETNITKYKE